MSYQENAIYHIYNQGNNKKLTFYNHGNYLFFLNKMMRHLKPYCDILAYCLMPNHFHWMVRVNKRGIAPSNKPIPRYLGPKEIFIPEEHCQQELSKQIATLLSSYARAINNQNGTSGSLFRSNTNIKHVQFDEEVDVYFPTCYDYIINNPVAAKITRTPEEYPYSSVSQHDFGFNELLINEDLLERLKEQTSVVLV